MATVSQKKLRLTDEERAMLDGACGPGVQRAMEMVVALAQIYGAGDLVPIQSTLVAGVSYANIGEAGLEFLQRWAAEGAHVAVPAMLNPAGMDLQAWQEMGIPPHFAAKQSQVIEAYRKMGVRPSCTCAPYLTQALPDLGDHLAWSESSAVAYANSILGARTNREGGPAALAAGIVGRTGNYGLHLDVNRQPDRAFLVRAPLVNEADWGALGAILGRLCAGVPWIEPPGTVLAASGDQRALSDHLRALGAAAAATGSIGLFHVAGLTAEARAGFVAPPNKRPQVIETLADGYAMLDGDAEHLDLIAIGCPHASLEQLQEASRYLEGKRVTIPVWFMLGRQLLQQLEGSQIAHILQASGARLVADTCVVVAPLNQIGIGAIGTNSAKAAFYLPSHQGIDTRFGSLERCLETAVRGYWR